MCGIICVLGSTKLVDLLIYGLTVLKNRGYDSCGVCYIERDMLEYAKYITPQCLKLLKTELCRRNVCSSIGIGHTRWATHGRVTELNAHPHFDNNHRLALVHNGIIENAFELKNELKTHGYVFYSQTDTEVIAVLTGYFLDQGNDVREAIEYTVKRLRGTWALVFLHRDYANTLWMTRNGSPLLLGTDPETNTVIVASENTAFGTCVQRYVVIEDHHILEITKEQDGTIRYNQNMDEYSIGTPINNDDTVLDRFQHYMLKEIHDQPESVSYALNNGARLLNETRVKLGGLDTHANVLQNIKHLILLGCGTSYHSALWSTHLFKQMEVFETVSVYDGGDFECKDLPRSRYNKTVMILVTQSGETKDLHRCIQYAQEKGVLTIGVVNAVDSMIARETDCGVYLNCRQETAVASTKSFTNQCVVLALICVWFSQNTNTHVEKRQRILSDISNLSFQLKMFLQEYTEQKIRPYIDLLEHRQSVFVLGKGMSRAIALEGALKLKEISYIHAEAFSSSSLKHGPLSLVTQDTPLILLDIDNEYHTTNWTCYQEICSRGGHVVYISNDPIQKVQCLKLAQNSTFSGVLANVFLQLLSYYLGVRRGNDVDFPRNLAKVVSVY